MLHEKIKKRDDLADVCSQMELVIRNTSTTKEYQLKYREVIKQKRKIEQDIRDIFDEMRAGRKSNYYYLDEFINEEKSFSSFDDDGNLIVERVMTGIEPIDKYFLGGNGLMLQGLFTLGGDSEVGKSYFMYHMMYSFVKQGYNVHFHSFELSRTQFLTDISVKKKLGDIVDNEENMKKITIDFSSYNMEEIEQMIRVREYEGARIFMIDSYAKLETGFDNEYNKMKKIADFFKKISNELGILIILIAQVSKNDSQNNINEFLGGTALKYDSDYSFFIHLVVGEETSGKRVIYCEKNRDHEGTSKTGIITGFDKETKKLYFISRQSEYKGVDEDGKEFKKLKFGKR